MLASPILMWLLWGGPDARVFVIFACLLGVAEYFVQLRWRMSVICRACGFDPVLYLKSPEKAAELVKKKLEDRQVNGVDLIQGPLQIPRLTPERAQTLARLEEMKKSKPGSLVSREI